MGYVRVAARNASQGTVAYSKFNRLGSTITAFFSAVSFTLIGSFVLFPDAEASRIEALPYAILGIASIVVLTRCWRTRAFRDNDTDELVVVNYFRTYVYPPNTRVVVRSLNSPFMPCYAPAVVLPDGRLRSIHPLQQWAIDPRVQGAPPAVVRWANILAPTVGEVGLERDT